MGEPSGLVLVHLAEQLVWRVGYRPEPWAWVGWEWASEGRFPGRWDDSRGNFRTVYAASSLLGCLLELLADFRPDPLVVNELDQIIDDDESHPTVPAGTLDPSWLNPRVAASARLTGWFADVTVARSLAVLHPLFIAEALQLGFRDLDAATLKDPRSRPLTQRLANHMYASTPVAGVQFRSRHGDDITLQAVFERPGDGPVTPTASHIEHHELTVAHPEVTKAMGMLGLQWREPDRMT